MADIQTLKAELEANNEAVKAQLAELAALKAQLQAQAGGLSKEDLKDILATVAPKKEDWLDGGGTAWKMPNGQPERQGRKLGPFEHPDGGERFPKPTLPCEDIFYGCVDSARDTRAMLRIRLDEITYFEAVAINELYASLGNGQRRVCRNGKWKVLKSDQGDRLDLLVPIKNPDDRQDLPSLLNIINELKTGERTKDAADMAEELALLKQQVAALSAR